MNGAAAAAAADDDKVHDQGQRGQEDGKVTQVAVRLEDDAVNDEGDDDDTRRLRSSRPVRRLLLSGLVMLTILAILVAIGAVIWFYLGWTAVILIYLFSAVTCLVILNREWLYVAFKTAPRDVRALYAYIRILLQIKGYQRKDITLAEIFQENIQKHPNKTCLIFEDQEWTFMQVEEYSNKIANIFKNHGYKKGDIVALFMENKPEYICIWLGLSKLGVIIPLINTNLRQTSLVHSITVAKSQAIIFGEELSEPLSEVLDKLDSKLAVYKLEVTNEPKPPQEGRITNLNLLLNEASTSQPTIGDKLSYHDHLVYIYTSGTTGLPKAAVISNSRFVFIAAAIHWTGQWNSEDRIYTPLPLYHTAGGCMSVGQMLIFGCTLIIRKKFSASAYFADIRKYNATISQYIGEMCRYVLAVPPSDKDKCHKLRLVYGNGLRPQIWKEFTERFNIPKVVEFYGATEGNANIVNVDNTVGAVGFISRIIPSVYPISIIKVDPETGEPIRNSKGLCMTCKPNEPGVFIGKIIPDNPSRAFLGYVDQEASKKKVVYNVFKEGDSAFISGDILIADKFGNLFFKDRTGDTFRWKGENVSTSEVEAVLSNIVNYKDVVVYGVEIKGQEGRAGMAAVLDPENSLDLDSLAEGIKKELPSYARPIFVRTLRKLDMTGTYKLKKKDLQSEGFNPLLIKDNIYYLDSTGKYTLLTEEAYEKINNGSIRV